MCELDYIKVLRPSELLGRRYNCLSHEKQPFFGIISNSNLRKTCHMYPFSKFHSANERSLHRLSLVFHGVGLGQGHYCK